MLSVESSVVTVAISLGFLLPLHEILTLDHGAESAF